jgi:hypothetical protein
MQAGEWVKTPIPVIVKVESGPLASGIQGREGRATDRFSKSPLPRLQLLCDIMVNVSVSRELHAKLIYVNITLG